MNLHSNGSCEGGVLLYFVCIVCVYVCIYMCIPLKPEYGDAGQRSFSATGEGDVLTAPYTKHVLDTWDKTRS